MSYRIENSKLREAVERQRATKPSLMDEVCVLRSLVEQAVNASEDPAQALKDLTGPITAVGKMIEAAEKLKMKSSELVSKTEMALIVNRIVDILTASLQTLPEPEYLRVVDSIVPQIACVLEE